MPRVGSRKNRIKHATPYNRPKDPKSIYPKSIYPTEDPDIEPVLDPRLQDFYNELITCNVNDFDTLKALPNKYNLLNILYDPGKYGIPTKAYSNLLWYILKRIYNYSREQLDAIQIFFFILDQESYTGIIKIQPSSAIYASCNKIARKASENGQKLFIHDGIIDLCNSTITICFKDRITYLDKRVQHAGTRRSRNRRRTHRKKN